MLHLSLFHHKKRITEPDRPSPICHKNCLSRQAILKTAAKHWISSRAPCPPELSDILWWHLFIADWNTISMLWDMAVVHVLNATYSKDPHLMHVIRILVFIAAHANFWFIARHIEGWANTIVDDLSHNNMVHFFTQVLQARLFTLPPILW